MMGCEFRKKDVELHIGLQSHTLLAIPAIRIVRFQISVVDIVSVCGKDLPV